MQTVVTAAIPALVTKFETALVGQGSGGANLPVKFPGSQVDVGNEFAAVAYAGPDGTRPGIAGLGKRSPMGNLATEEDAVINCCLSASYGDTDISMNLFTLVAGWFNILTTALQADVHLSNSVPPPGMVEMGPYEWYVSEEGGSTVTLAFGVHIAGAWSQ